MTGGSRGIGPSIARTFAADAARVMITARREDGLRDAARRVDGAEWFVANAGRPEDAQAAVAECLQSPRRQRQHVVEWLSYLTA